MTPELTKALRRRTCRIETDTDDTSYTPLVRSILKFLKTTEGDMPKKMMKKEKPKKKK